MASNDQMSRIAAQISTAWVLRLNVNQLKLELAMRSILISGNPKKADLIDKLIEVRAFFDLIRGVQHYLHFGPLTTSLRGLNILLLVTPNLSVLS